MLGGVSKNYVKCQTAFERKNLIDLWKAYSQAEFSWLKIKL